jgi:acyl-CoA thioesterase
MSSPLQTLLDALDAKPLGDDRFEARSIEYLRPRIFGGELLAQVLATAARTAQDRACHAIHVEFLFPGDPKVPIEYPAVPPTAPTWIKAIAAMPDDQALHCAVLAYASDATLLDIACYPHGVSWISPNAQQASLSYGMWLHRPVRVDEWLLYSQHVASSAGGRAIARCSMFTRRRARRIGGAGRALADRARRVHARREIGDGDSSCRRSSWRRKRAGFCGG